MTTPSITAAQVAALATFAGSQAVAFGLLTQPKEQTILAVAGTAIAVALKACDAAIRIGRGRYAIELAAERHQVNIQGVNQYVAQLQAELEQAQGIVNAMKGQTPAEPQS